MRYAFAFVFALWVASLLFAGMARASYQQPIYVSNTSTGVTDAQVAAALPAFQTAASRDFAPVWGTDALLTLLPAGATAPFGSWTISIEDNFSFTGELGYHDVQGGVPFAKVFPDMPLDSGAWQITFTHELFEMLGDPYADRTVNVQRRLYPFYYLETGDPVEADGFAYLVDGTLISDFVTPLWFRAGSKGPWDFTGHVRRPLQILRGGYQIAWSKKLNQWTQLCYLNRLCARPQLRR